MIILQVPKDSMQPVIFIAAGVILMLLFIYLNFRVQPRWFPNDMARAGVGSAAEMPNPSTHRLLGAVEIVLFLVSVVLIVAGCVMIGTSHGYG